MLTVCALYLAVRGPLTLLGLAHARAELDSRASDAGLPTVYATMEGAVPDAYYSLGVGSRRFIVGSGVDELVCEEMRGTSAVVVWSLRLERASWPLS
jgi:hypothetical protein